MKKRIEIDGEKLKERYAVNIRFDYSELQMLDTLAEAKGLNRTSFMRHLLYLAYDNNRDLELPSKKDICMNTLVLQKAVLTMNEIVNSVFKATNNINQIAKKVNKVGFLENTEELTTELQDLVCDLSWLIHRLEMRK